VTCRTCHKSLDERRDVRYDTDNRTFCSLICVYRYRGKVKIV
jgi:hypothetical protein